MNDGIGIFVRLYLDEDIQKLIAPALRARQYDVISAREIGRWGFSDFDQLSYAADQGRAIFSYNIADYLKLHNDWFQLGREHAGIILSPQLTISDAVSHLSSFLNQVSADEMHNQLLWL